MCKQDQKVNVLVVYTGNETDCMLQKIIWYSGQYGHAGMNRGFVQSSFFCQICHITHLIHTFAQRGQRRIYSLVKVKLEKKLHQNNSVKISLQIN